MSGDDKLQAPPSAGRLPTAILKVSVDTALRVDVGSRELLEELLHAAGPEVALKLMAKLRKATLDARQLEYLAGDEATRPLGVTLLAICSLLRMPARPLVDGARALIRVDGVDRAGACAELLRRTADGDFGKFAQGLAREIQSEDQ